VTAEGAVTRKVTRTGAGWSAGPGHVIRTATDADRTLQGAPERPSWALTRQALGSVVRL
jgi:hypothetical protein